MTAFLGRTAPDGTAITTSSDLALYLLRDTYGSAVSSDSFGAPACIRFSTAAADKKLAEAFGRIKRSLGGAEVRGA